jgi:hypothetical protein
MPTGQRFLIASNAVGDRAVESILKAPDGIAQKYGLNKAQRDAFKLQLLGGPATHLRSVPIGLRVRETISLHFAL